MHRGTTSLHTSHNTSIVYYMHTIMLITSINFLQANCEKILFKTCTLHNRPLLNLFTFSHPSLVDYWNFKVWIFDADIINQPAVDTKHVIQWVVCLSQHHVVSTYLEYSTTAISLPNAHNRCKVRMYSLYIHSVLLPSQHLVVHLVFGTAISTSSYINMVVVSKRCLWLPQQMVPAAARSGCYVLLCRCEWLCLYISKLRSWFGLSKHQESPMSVCAWATYDCHVYTPPPFRLCPLVASDQTVCTGAQ